MSDVQELLRQYIDEQRARPDTDPLPYLERVSGTDRVELEALIDEYLARAPRRAFDEQAYGRSGAPAVVESLSRSLEGSAGLWPSLLPRLRARARIKRGDLVAELAARLGAESKREKVGWYYHRMEQGLLPEEGVSDTVLEALGKIVGQSAEQLRRAGRAVAPAPGAPSASEAAAYARTARAGPDSAGEPAPGREREQEPDEVDRLFTGG
jgi:hypothetical protein